MNPTHEEALFALVLAKPVERRAEFLEKVCESDASLRARLEALLAAHDGTGVIPAADSVSEELTPTLELVEPVADEAVGQTLGRYKLLERVGEGGCGVVYVAEQTEPVRRRVALKVIKLGMDTKQVVARFEAERQALAMMDHPNIAKVLDAGTTDTGRPYFVMELVRGIRITEYCDQSNLSTQARLELFIKVCQAIQHAHQKGIIHRDIKPSNILVTLHDGVPVPKVIDFGIAKATEGRLTDATVYTQLHQFIGTPAYMSPEQAEMSGLDIDTRSDIYSLGVLLYELLTGSTPFDGKELMSGGIDAMRKTIREKEPPKPSTRLGTFGADQLTTTAKRRSSDTAKLLHQLKGDLDWIAMMCLEKDRQRRYETANGLAADLQRYLNNEPIIARPPSAAYKIQKAWQRNKLVFSAAAAVGLAMLIGLGVAALGWRRAQTERDNALKAESRAHAAQEKAEQSQRSEQQQRLQADQERQRATAGEARAQRLLYAADMNRAQQFVNEGNLGRARQLLDRHRPAPGEEDLRGWEWRYLWQQCRSEALVTLAQHPGKSSTSVSFSSDGAHLAVGYSDGQIEIWDVARRRLEKVLQTNGQAARVAFSPRSNVLAATANRGNLKLYDLSSGRESVLWRDTNAIRELSFALDSQRLVAFVFAPRMSAAVTFDPGQGRVVRTDDTSGGHNFRGNARLSSDGTRLFLTHRDPVTRLSSVRCLEAGTGRTLWQGGLGTNTSSSATAMALSPDDKFLLISDGGEDSRIQVWSTATRKRVASLEGHTAAVREMAFSPDGRSLASASADQTVRLWATSGEASRWTQERALRGHGDLVVAVAFSPDGRLLASAARDGDVLLWDTGPDRKSNFGYHLLPGDIKSLDEISPGIALANGPKFSMTDLSEQSGRRFLLRLEDQSELPVPPGFDFDANFNLFHPNHFVSYEQTNVVRVLDLGNGWLERFREEVGPVLEGFLLDATPIKRDDSTQYASTPRLLGWSETSGSVQLVELGPSKRRWRWNSDLRSPTPLQFSPDGSLLLLSRLIGAGAFERWSEGWEVREVATGNLLLKSELPTAHRGVRFADNGRKLVAMAKADNTVQMLFWDLTRPKEPPIAFPLIVGPTGANGLERPDVSPDGRWVSLIGLAGEIELYDAVLVARRGVLKLAEQTSFVTCFSLDSQRLISAAGGLGGKASIQLWQVDTGQELLTLPARSAVDSFRFAEDANTLMAGLQSVSSWQMWRAPSWEYIHAAEANEKR